MQYVKTRSRATMKGEWYEVKVAALLYLRSRNSARVARFQLATNVEGAGALDDLVHRVTYRQDPDTWHTSFIQLKHKERALLGLNSFTGHKGDYSLVKYLDSFREIRKAKEDNANKNRLFFDGSFDHFQFVIYTNSKVNPDLFTSIPLKSGCLEELLKSNCQNELIFMFDKEKTGVVFEFLEAVEATRVDAAEFLEKLSVFSGQPTESDLDDIIKKELLIACGGKVSDAGPVYRIFEGLFKQWWRDSNIVLDETSDILQRTLSQLTDEVELIKQTDQCTLDISFDQTLWTRFNTGFSEGVSLLHVVATGGSLRLSATKVLRLLHSEKLSFTFVSLDYLAQHQLVLISEWRDGYKDCLVVVSDKCKSNEPLAQLINEVLVHNPNKKVVLVSSQSCQFANYFKPKKIVKRYKTIADMFQLTDLDQQSLHKIFHKEMLFQDQTIALRSLYSGDEGFWEGVLDDYLVDKIVSDVQISIGAKLPSVIQHYVPRRLKKCNILRRDILKPGNCEDTVAVGGVALHELNELLGLEDDVMLARHRLDSPHHRRRLQRSDSSILVLDEVAAVEEFNELGQREHTVHWIHVEDEVLSLIASKGDLSDIKQFIDETQFSVVPSEDVMASGNRVDLVIAEPGMGKTSLLPALAQTAKNASPADWVIHINLRDNSELFNKSPQFGALDFLTLALRIDSPLERAFLQVSLELTGNIVVMLDSFDEICPRYQHEGCDLLTSILKTRVKKVVVTSRHSMQRMLENHLSTLAYNIVEFSEDDQVMFFRKFWSQSSTPMTSEQLEEFITQLIDSVNAFDTERRLMGIPLQTMMLAEVFHDHVMNPEHNKFPQRLDLISLFEQFVERKFMIYFRKGSNNLNAKKSRQKFVMGHMHAALRLLVHENDVRQIISEQDIIVHGDKLVKNIADAINNSGLIINVVNNRAIFLHQMLAEYLAGRWFVENFHSNGDFLKAYLFAPNYSVIRLMFDRIMSRGHQLHEAVLDMDMARLETLLAVEGVNVNATDNGGRSALHLAAAVGFEFEFEFIIAYSIGRESYEKSRKVGPRPRHMVELLMEHGANANQSDTVLSWTPLEYALQSKTWDAMEYLLAGRADSCDLGLSSVMEDKNLLEHLLLYGFSNILALLLHQGLSANLDVYGRSLLYRASRYGYAECVELLLSRGADKRVQDYHKDVPLHAASRSGHLSVVRALIENTVASRVKILTFLKSEFKSDFFGKYVNIKNGLGKSALHLAMTSEICLLLVLHGADLWSRDQLKRTCLHTISSDGRLSVVETLIDSLGPDRLAKSKFINAVDDYKRSAIVLPCKNGHADIVRYLISQGADVWSRDKWGRTCLHYAGIGEVARILIDSLGEDKDAVTQHILTQDSDGVSALVEASSGGCSEVVDLLISHGAEVWSRDERGRTSLHAAAELCDKALAQALIGCLGDDKAAVVDYINSRDNKGLSARHVAQKQSVFASDVKIRDFLDYLDTILEQNMGDPDSLSLYR